MTLVGNVQLVRGGTGMLPVVLEMLEREGIKTKGNLDLYARSYAHFSIEDARSIRDRATRGAIAGDRRVFVIAAPVIAADAQNTLLKTIEEPAGNALFIFIVPSPETLLPTVCSRAQILVLASAEGAKHLVDEKKFLKADIPARLELLKPLLDKGEEERRDLGAIITFLSSLERVLATVKPLEHAAGLEAIYRARKYIADKGALVKPLLEQVALLVPRV
ncbi:MAG: hypothetical protein Q8R25_04570 [bacterium]|nr:hypothetical protein [bacterium]